jgi:hypothetical protein
MVVDGAGFILNNRGSYFGLDPADINVIAPGKRTRQGAIPAMALKNGKPFLAWNTPGGDTIPQTLTQAFLNVVEFGMNVQQAAEAPCIVTSNFRVSMYPQNPGDGLMPKLLADHVGSALSSLGHCPGLPLSSVRNAVRRRRGKMILIDQSSGVMFGGASPGKRQLRVGLVISSSALTLTRLKLQLSDNNMSSSQPIKMSILDFPVSGRWWKRLRSRWWTASTWSWTRDPNRKVESTCSPSTANTICRIRHTAISATFSSAAGS